MWMKTTTTQENNQNIVENLRKNEKYTLVKN